MFVKLSFNKYVLFTVQGTQAIQSDRNGGKKQVKKKSNSKKENRI